MWEGVGCGWFAAFIVGLVPVMLVLGVYCGVMVTVCYIRFLSCHVLPFSFNNSLTSFLLWSLSYSW